jgi:hypothetical protein
MRITKNNLIWYFIRSREQLPASYVRSCDKFFKSIGEKNVASSEILRRAPRRKRKELERQATSNKHERKHKLKMSIKRQATSDKRLSKTAIKIHEAWAYQNGYRATSIKQQAPGIQIQEF